MADFKKDLQVVVKEIKSLTRKVEKLSQKIEKAESKTAKKAAPKKKRGASAKAEARQEGEGATAAPKAKGGDKASAIDTVFGFIARSKSGLDSAALMKKSGFDRKKIQNIVHRLKKQGKIKTLAKGNYAKA